MNEIWATLSEFPKYLINEFGEVVNESTGHVLAQSMNQNGVVKVNILDNGRHHTRSVKILVAIAFVERYDEICNTPIHLDGDTQNNHVSNIVWRPRWFANKYTRQFYEITELHDLGPIVDTETKAVYKTYFDAAIIHGLLVDDIWRSVRTGKPVFPTDQIFKKTR
jgi:hypothetical protein